MLASFAMCLAACSDNVGTASSSAQGGTENATSQTAATYEAETSAVHSGGAEASGSSAVSDSRSGADSQPDGGAAQSSQSSQTSQTSQSHDGASSSQSSSGGSGSSKQNSSTAEGGAGQNYDYQSPETDKPQPTAAPDDPGERDNAEVDFNDLI